MTAFENLLENEKRGCVGCVLATQQFKMLSFIHTSCVQVRKHETGKDTFCKYETHHRKYETESKVAFCKYETHQVPADAITVNTNTEDEVQSY